MNKKKIKKVILIILVFILLTFSTFSSRLKLEFHRKHIHKKHKPKVARIKPVDTLAMEKEVYRHKLFTREQIVKKRKIEVKKHKEKLARIKRESEKKRIAEQKKREDEKPYIIREIEVTAYTNNGGSGHGITASGAHTQEGVTIAAPSWVPMGSIIEINGHKYTVQDRGGRVVGNTFDLFIEDEQRAIEFGRKNVTAKIYKN